jgi:hypothetical protein
LGAVFEILLQALVKRTKNEQIEYFVTDMERALAVFGVPVGYCQLHVNKAVATHVRCDMKCAELCKFDKAFCFEAN